MGGGVAQRGERGVGVHEAARPRLELAGVVAAMGRAAAIGGELKRALFSAASD